MNRKHLAIGLLFGAMAMFIVGLNMLEGNRISQSVVALAYAAAVVLIVRWGNRAAA